MGQASSRVEEDKALQLCRERKKLIRQALDGRCALAATHVSYIQSLNVTGSALRRFVEPDGPVVSSLCTSTSVTPRPAGLSDKPHSQFSLTSPSFSQHMDASESRSTFHTPSSSHFQANHMKVQASSSKKVEEKPPVPVLGSVTSSDAHNTTLHSFKSPEASEPLPWDYFGFFHPIDRQFSSKETRELSQRLVFADEIRHTKEDVVSPLEGEIMEGMSPRMEELLESEDEFDDPSTEKLVRSFKNVNTATNNIAVTDLPAIPSGESVLSETEFLTRGKFNSPILSPLRTAPGGVFHSDVKATILKDDNVRNKVSKDFFSSMKDIEYLFIKASDSGREVPRMLEANKFHFRPIFPGKEGGSIASTLLKSCFSCGDDPSQVQEKPVAQTTTKYLTWHRTTSSRSSSSRNHLEEKTGDDLEDLTSNLFDNFCMVSGSHASTLDRLHAWERKLYDEVKASGVVRRDYDQKRKLLRQLESNGERSDKIDKTRAVVKDLHSRIRVAIQRIDSISKKIEDLRDKELQPQLEELIEGLRKMWEVMFECHKLQFERLSVVGNKNANYDISLQSESRRQITIQLETELGTLSLSFMKWIEAQKSYVQAINGWLFKCVSLPENPSRRKRRIQAPPLRNYGPPIYVTCGVWIDKLEGLPCKEVVDSIRALAVEISHLLPRQEKNQGKGTNTHSTSWHGGSRTGDGFNTMRDEVSENRVTGFDDFRSCLIDFLGHLSSFAGSCVTMFIELQESIDEAKRRNA